ncbi:MAG: BREX system ATP-binding protein BrxD [Sandaracinaceae bacterium]
MSTMTHRDVQHVFEKLRNGLVPERGIDTFAVGIEKHREEIHRQLDLAMNGEGTTKFLRGDYGCGKTFMARLAVLDAQRQGFATSFVVVSDNDLKLHKFDDVYRKVVSELGTASCPRGALSDILDRWIGEVEDALIDADHDENAPDFDALVRERLQADLAAHTGGKISHDFVRVIQTIFDLKQKGESAEAGALISWLSGSGNVSASAKKVAGIKGDIGSRDAMEYLRGILEIVKAAKYKGLVIVIDEAETILRMRKDTRHKSLNGIRQIADAAGSFPGLLWIFTGTPAFFDERRGVAGLAPLHDRIAFIDNGRFTNLKQPQLNLIPFDEERLKKVALRLRDLYMSKAKRADEIEAKVSTTFIERLVAEVTKGFKADVGVVPRQFLRTFVTQLDTVDDFADYDPMTQYGFEPVELSPQEQEAMRGGAVSPDADPDEEVAVEQVW